MRHAVTQRKKLRDVDLEKDHGIEGKVFINESMTFEVKSLDWKCRQLKKSGHLQDCWFFNGNYNVVHKAGEEKQKVIHIVDICTLTGMNEKEIDDICEEFKEVKAKPRASLPT